jgi:hypothetical protein
MSKQFSLRKKTSVLSKTQGRCAYCGTDLGECGVVIDHVHPRALGGGNELENLLPACSPCNTSKGKKTLEQFRLFSAAKKVTGAAVFGQAQVEYLHAAGAFEILGFNASHQFHFELAEGC